MVNIAAMIAAILADEDHKRRLNESRGVPLTDGDYRFILACLIILICASLLFTGAIIAKSI